VESASHFAAHGRFDFAPWLFAREATEEERAEQTRWQAELAGRGAVVLDSDVFVSPRAAVFPSVCGWGERATSPGMRM
jgi:hypothetical protein